MTVVSTPKTFRIFIALCLLVCCEFLFAEQQIAALETMVVKADRLSASDVDLEALPGFVSLIERQEFEGKFATVADILKSEPGIQVREAGGLGSFSSISLRGSSSQQVNVYLDGVLLNNVVSGTVDLSRISLGQIQSIEVYRGAPPIQFGSAAIGGAINIKTLKHSAQSQGELVLGYGSFNSKKMDLSLSQKLGDITISAAAGYQGSDNDFEFTNDNQTRFNTNDDQIQSRQNNAIEMANGLLSAGYQISNTSQLTARVQHYNKDQQIPDVFNTQDTNSALDSRLTQFQLQFDEDDWKEGSYSISAFVARNKEHFHDRQGRIGSGRQEEVAVTSSIGTSANANHFIWGHLFSASFEFKNDDYKNEQLIGDTEEQNFKRQSLTLGLQDEMPVWNEQSQLQVGLRVKHIHDQGQLPPSENLPDVDDTEIYFSGYTGLRWDWKHWLRFKTNLSRGIRVPRLSEKFGDRGLFIGNPELVEEEAINVDFGFEYDLRRVELSAVIFHRWLDNAIVATYDSRGVGRFENISKALAQGLELTAVYKPADWIGLSLKSTVQGTENTSDNKDQNGKQLAGHYQMAHFLGFQARYKSFTGQLEYQHESGGYYDNTESVQIPDRDQINIVLRYQPVFISNTQLTLEVNNITDAEYEAFNSYPSPGRHLFFTIASNF